jgi:parallel beta-helix repeat protein
MTSGGCTITGCSVYSNTGEGIQADFGSSTITRCTVRGSTLNGIRAASGCVIAYNTCDSNGAGAGIGAGIIATSSDCCIEHNNVTNNDFGIKIDGVNNIVFGNTARSNTSGNYNMVAGNRVGVIVVPAISGPVTGNSGAAGFGTTDPSANFGY